MKILFAGGGSGGPVAPLIAVAKEIKKQDPKSEFLFVGTRMGPEQQMVEEAGFSFRSIPTAKLRRYFSLRNFLDIFIFIFSLFKANALWSQFRPEVIFTAGGFSAVPIAWIGWMRGSRIIIHQQDARPGLANKLVSPFASVITTTFLETAKRFYTNSGVLKNENRRRIEWVGNPVRPEFFDNSLPYKDFFRLHDRLPILLVFGGATGAKQINDVVSQCLPELLRANQVVHLTGKGKNDITFKHEDYHVYEFLGQEMPTIMKMAHVVLTRAGLSTISELSILGKVAIVVPMSGTHQVDNAAILEDANAAIVLDKEDFTPKNLVDTINNVKFNVERQKLLSQNIKELMPRDSAARIAGIIINKS